MLLNRAPQYGIPFYLQYLAHWPEYFVVAEAPGGELMGYSECGRRCYPAGENEASQRLPFHEGLRASRGARSSSSGFVVPSVARSAGCGGVRPGVTQVKARVQAVL